jgi:hypothetical protein
VARGKEAESGKVAMMAMDPIQHLARTIFAMSKKKKSTDIAKSMNEECFQRSWTDEMHRALGMSKMEYDLKYKKVRRIEPISAEQKAEWEAAARRGE